MFLAAKYDDLFYTILSQAMLQALDILKGEFSAYYTNGDLPREWNESAITVDLPRMAKDSSDRLKRRVGAQSLSIAEMVVALEVLHNNAPTDFLQSLKQFDAPDWTNDSNKVVFQYIAKLMVDFIQV